MSIPLFIVALVLGAGALALWIDVRFPGLAPSDPRIRVAVAVIATGVVSIIPVSSAGGTATLVSLLGVVLPTLCFALLTSLWLLRLVADRRL